jgi:hypothetical protein
MLHYDIEVKRVLVMDEEIEKEGISGEAWQKIMKMILGRHYADLNKKGPGWSFPRYALEKFQEMLEKEVVSTKESIETLATAIETKDSTCQTPAIKKTIETKESACQTPAIKKTIETHKKTHHLYKHNISEELIRFGKSFLQEE